MDLRVCVKISNSLDINNNELVSWAFKGEVTKGLEEPQKMSEVYWKQQHIFTFYKWRKKSDNPIGEI